MRIAAIVAIVMLAFACGGGGGGNNEPADGDTKEKIDTGVPGFDQRTPEDIVAVETPVEEWKEEDILDRWWADLDIYFPPDIVDAGADGAAGDSKLGEGSIDQGGEEGVKVKAHVTSEWVFARVFGLESVDVERHAAGVRAYTGGLTMVPLWISLWELFPEGLPDPDDPVEPDELYVDRELFYAQDVEPNLDPDDATFIPSGNFGFLEPLSNPSDFDNLLGGINLTDTMLLDNYVEVGAQVDAYTGASVGIWDQALGDKKATGRLSRAVPYDAAGEDTSSFSDDNPHLIILPLVSYVGDSGGGSGATYTIEAFGAFWLTGVNGQTKSITGQFIDFAVPGYSDGPVFGGVISIRLVS